MFAWQIFLYKNSLRNTHLQICNKNVQRVKLIYKTQYSDTVFVTLCMFDAIYVWNCVSTLKLCIYVWNCVSMFEIVYLYSEIMYLLWNRVSTSEIMYLLWNRVSTLKSCTCIYIWNCVSTFEIVYLWYGYSNKKGARIF